MGIKEALYLSDTVSLQSLSTLPQNLLRRGLIKTWRLAWHYLSHFIMLHPLLTYCSLRAGEKSSLPKAAVRMKVYLDSYNRYLESTGFGAHILDSLLSLYPVKSLKHRCLELKKLNHLSSHSSYTDHFTFSPLLYKKVPELNMDRSSNNKELWNLSLPIPYPLQAPTCKPSQEARTPWGWGNTIDPSSPSSSSSNAWKSCSNIWMPEAVLQCVANRAEEEKKLVSMNPASSKCRLFLGRFD